MAEYSLALRTTRATINLAAWDFVAAANTRPRVKEIHVVLASAVISQVALRRTSAVGTRTTPTVYLATDPADSAAVSSSALAWTVEPTITAGDIRRFGAPATIGSGIVWTFGNGLIVPASTGLALVNVVAGAVFDVTAIIDE